MLGGRPLQDIAAELHGDGKSWRIGKLDFRAPGTTRVLLSEASAKGCFARPVQGRSQCRIHRSGRADDLATGPRRYGLSAVRVARSQRAFHEPPSISAPSWRSIGKSVGGYRCVAVQPHGFWLR